LASLPESRVFISILFIGIETLDSGRCTTGGCMALLLSYLALVKIRKI
jgi:hypothetical protein